MPRIMCTQRLWKALGQPGRPPVDPDGPLLHGVLLRNWAATVFRDDDRDLIIALNDQTYLTVVCPLEPRDQLRQNIEAGVRHALRDLHVPEAAVLIESAAVEYAPLCRLRHAALTRALKDLEFACRCELDYHSDLRIVQRNLNEFPHADLDVHVPVEAVARLFTSRAAVHQLRSH